MVIKGNETNIKMPANTLPFNTPLTPVLGSKGQNYFFSEGGLMMLHVKLKEMKHRTNASKKFDLIHTPWPVRVGLGCLFV